MPQLVPHTDERAGVLEGDGIAALEAEARALLEAVREKRAVPAGRVQRFARACLETSEVGRLALAVLDGGPFTGARLVELGDLVLSGATARKRSATS